jgi:long-chain acyl-CoA synthetase
VSHFSHVKAQSSLRGKGLTKHQQPADYLAMSLNLDTVFQETARQQPRHAAIVGSRAAERLSYRELDQAIARAARELRRSGLRSGDCVGLHFPSGRDYIIFTYAIWRNGGSVVPIPIELRPAEKHEIARKISLDLVLSQSRNLSDVAPLIAASPVQLGDNGWAGRALKLRDPPGPLARMNPAFIRFTSGTTADSKGVVLSHETINDRILAANQAIAAGPQDRIVWVLSMAYHFAVSIVSYLSFGATIVLPGNVFAPAILAAARERSATIIYASPTHFQWLADCDEAGRISALRLAISTTAPLDRATAESFQNRFGLPLTQALGIIEVGLPFINIDFAATKPESVGRVLPAYELQLKDVGLGPNRREITLRGHGILDAYYDPFQPREEILADGWFATGDIGELDADGCLFLRGRAKELISVMGLKFFPQEVEAVLLAHPSVQQASVFGQIDERFGQVPCARVVTSDTAGGGLERQLLAHCRQRVAEYKVPRRIEFVRAIPTTASGKIVRRTVST